MGRQAGRKETAPGGGPAPSQVARAEGRSTSLAGGDSGFRRIDHVRRAGARRAWRVGGGSGMARAEAGALRARGCAEVGRVLETAADDRLDLGQGPVESGAG